MAVGTAKQNVALKASGTQAVNTSYYPASTGINLSIVQDQNTIAIWHTNAGDPSSTVDLTVEYSRDGTNWFTPVASSGDTFAQVTSTAVKQVRKTLVHANFLRVKSVVGTATSGAFDIQMDFQGQGAYSA